MDNDDPVLRALDALAAADRSRRAPPRVERELLEAFDRQARRRWFARTPTRSWIAGMAAAAVFAAVMTTIGVYVRRTEPPRSAGPSGSPAVDRGAQAATSTSLPPSETPRLRVMTAGGEDAFIQTVRLRIPRAYLPILGVPIIDPDAEGTVVVEVLVNEEGLGRGVRILQ